MNYISGHLRDGVGPRGFCHNGGHRPTGAMSDGRRLCQPDVEVGGQRPTEDVPHRFSRSSAQGSEDLDQEPSHGRRTGLRYFHEALQLLGSREALR